MKTMRNFLHKKSRSGTQGSDSSSFVNIPPNEAIPGTLPSAPTPTSPRHFQPGYKIQPDEIRELTELIRLRYREDLSIWAKRWVEPRDYPEVQVMMRRSDDILLRIKQIVESYDRRELFETDQDWVKWQDIKARVKMAGKQEWVRNPPWNDPDR